MHRLAKFIPLLLLGAVGCGHPSPEPAATAGAESSTSDAGSGEADESRSSQSSAGEVGSSDASSGATAATSSAETDTATSVGSDDDSSGSPTTAGNDPGAPIIVTLDANVTLVTPTQPMTISVIVTDPDGVDDVIGGQLQTENGDVVLGTFQSAADEGAYTLTISYADFGVAELIEFAPGPVGRTLRVEFFDESANSSRETLNFQLGCDEPGEAMCDDACVVAECHPTLFPCAGGQVCFAGSCIEGPTGRDSAGQNCFVEQPLACEHLCLVSLDRPLSCGTGACCSGAPCDPENDDCPGGLTCTSFPWAGSDCPASAIHVCL